MDDRSERTSPAAGRSGTSIAISEVKFGKLVQAPRGPVVSGFEHAITARARDMPPDVADLCRPDLLVPADANPIQMVESWAQDRGGLVIVPVVRAGVSVNDRLWVISGRIRPYTERGVGQGGRPATMLTAWPLPANGFATAIPMLAAAMAGNLSAEPELQSAAASERMARGPITIPGREPAVATVGDIPKAAILILEALRRGRPSRWTKATFADEQAFLDCLAVVYRLIPTVRGGVQPRALLSASSGITLGAENFLVSYVRDATATNDDKARLPSHWETYLVRSSGEAIADLVARAEAGAQWPQTPNDPGRTKFGHAGSLEDQWAAHGLSEALRTYKDPGYVQAPVDRIYQGIAKQRPAAGQTVVPQRPQGSSLNPYAQLYDSSRRGSYPGSPSGTSTYDERTQMPRREHEPKAGPLAGKENQPISYGTTEVAGGQREGASQASGGARGVRPPAYTNRPTNIGSGPVAGPPPKPSASLPMPWISEAASQLRLAIETTPDYQQDQMVGHVMSELVQQIIDRWVLDNYDLRQLFEWKASTRQDMLRVISDWAEREYAGGSEAKALRDVFDRSAALQAWRVRRPLANGLSTPMDPIERDLVAFAYGWRDQKHASHGEAWLPRAVGHAFHALIYRTSKGNPPVIDLDELAQLKPLLSDSGELAEIRDRLTNALNQTPPPGEINGMPPGSAASFLRRLNDYLRSITS